MSARAWFFAKRAAIAAGVFAVLLFPWPGLEDAYAASFRGLADVTFSLVGFSAVEFHANPLYDGSSEDTFVFVSDAPHGGEWGALCDAWFLGFVPSAIFLALWAATPLSRGARWRALLLGGLLVHVFVCSRVALVVLDRWTRHAAESPEHGHPTFLLVPAWKAVVRTLDELQANPFVYVVVPMGAWALVALRRAAERRTAVRRADGQPGRHRAGGGPLDRNGPAQVA